MFKQFKYFFLGLILVSSIYFRSGSAQPFEKKAFSTSRTDTTNIHRVGNWPYGSALAVTVDTTRNLVFLGSGGAVLALDVSDLSKPKLISDAINTRGLVEDLRYNYQKQHLYVAARYEDCQVWDVRNPESPQKLAQFELVNGYSDTEVNNVEFSGNYAILECASAFVNTVDISDLQNPVWVGRESLMGNPSFDIHLAANGLLHSVGAQYYTPISIGPNGSLNGIPFLNGANYVFGIDYTVFLGRGSDLIIANLLNPNTPVWSISEVGFMEDIYVQGNFVYLTIKDRLDIYDVSNYQYPLLKGSDTIPGYPRKLEVIDNIAYLSGRFSGLRNINIEDPAAPREVGLYETFGSSFSMVRAGDYGFVAELDDGMLVMDLSDLSQPTMVGQYDTPGNTYAIDVLGNLAFIADAEGGLRIADISDPLNPVEVGSLNTFSYATDVCIDGNYAYVVDGIIDQPDLIKVVDISDPTQPNEVAAIQMQSNVDELTVSGNYLYAAAAEDGLRVFDISDPANPIEAGAFIAPNVYDVCVQGNYAYLASADWEGGFVTLDVSDPTDPVFISTYDWDGWLHPFDVAVEGEYAYIGVPTYDLFLLMYIGDPAHPSELGSFYMSGDVIDIYAQDSLIYVSDGPAGLHIFENKLYSTPGAGITWVQQSSGTSEELWSIYFRNATTGWVAGDKGTILKTDDGGQAWVQKMSGTTSELFSIFFANENTGWAAGRDGTILNSIDGGDDWQPQQTGTTNVLRSVHFVDSNNGWAAGEGGMILHTDNGGQTWQPQFSNTSTYLLRVFFTDLNHGWVSGWNGLLLRTDDGGANWQQSSLPIPADITDFYFVDQNTGWAVTTDVEIFKSNDGGSTWMLQYSNQQYAHDVLTSIHFVDDQRGWAVGHGGKIVSTIDGGNSWTEQTSGVLTFLTSVNFVNRYTGWVAGKDGMILKAVSPVGIEDKPIPDASLPERYILMQNYPNPFNPTTRIQYELPEATAVTLKIYNPVGQEIRTLVNSNQAAGVHSVVWDGRNENGNPVSSGVYVYSIQTEKFQQSRKMVLMR